jgi:hypothetical protein
LAFRLRLVCLLSVAADQAPFAHTARASLAHALEPASKANDLVDHLHAHGRNHLRARAGDSMMPFGLLSMKLDARVRHGGLNPNEPPESLSGDRQDTDHRRQVKKT